MSSTRSVLDEIYSNGDSVPDRPATPVQQPSATPATPGGDVSHTQRTRITQPSDTLATDVPAATAAVKPARTGTRTPAGKKRHSLYLDDDIAQGLNETADRLTRQLGGMVPKHRILGALITAGINQASTVAAQLRAELLDALN